MTSQHQKGMVPPSKVLEKVVQARALGLEKMSCVIPKVSNRVVSAATDNNSTVFPLKESYSRYIQHPHSQTFWKNSTKDYRHELLDEVAQEDEKRSNNKQARPKMGRIPDTPPRAHLYHTQDPEREEVEAEYIDVNHEMLEENLFHEFRGTVATKVLETDQWDGPNFPHHDAAYNAILNVQEDEDHMKSSEIFQSHSDIGNEGNASPLLTEHVFQEYIRLMAICEKHEEKEMAIRKARLNLESQNFQEQKYAIIKPLSSGRRHRLVERNSFVKNDAVSDSRRSYDIGGIGSSTRLSRGERGQSETRSRLEQATLGRSGSFDSRWESFEGNGVGNKGHAVSGASKTTFLADSLSSTWQRNIGDVPATTQSKRYEKESLGFHQKRRTESFPSASSQSGEEPSYISSSVPTAMALKESAQKEHTDMREDEFTSKITVVGPQHALDPIFCSSSSSLEIPSNRSDLTRSSSRNVPKGDAKILKTIQTTEEDETVPFDEIWEQKIDDVFTSNDTIPESSHSNGPVLVSDSSSSTPLNQGVGGVKRTESTSSLRDGAYLPAPSELSRQSISARYGSSSRNKEESFLNVQPVIDQSSSTILWQKKRELSSLSSMQLKNSVAIDKRHGTIHSGACGSRIIELNTPAVASELSFSPSLNMQPITPSPKESDNCRQQFMMSPELDVQCDKRKKHQFYEANPYIPAYSDSVIIGRPVSPENSNQYGNQEHGSIAGLSPVTCSASQFRNNVFANTKIHSEDVWGDESVDREPVERSNETIKVQHLSSRREVNPQVSDNLPPLQTCMPLINKKLRSVLDRYNALKESTRPPQTTGALRAEPDRHV